MCFLGLLTPYENAGRGKWLGLPNHEILRLLQREAPKQWSMDLQVN